MRLNHREVRFKSGSLFCAGTLYLPSKKNRAPCIILGHGFGGVRKMLSPYAEYFAQQGWVVLTFDYRNFGDSDGHKRQVLDIRSQLGDWRAAISFARSQFEVDPDKVAIWGSSLGGGHVLVIGGEDQKISAVIAQVPHISGWQALRAMGIKHSVKLLPALFQDFLAVLLGLKRRTLPLVAERDELAIMQGDDSRSFLNVVRDLAPGTSIEVAALSPLMVAVYFPGYFLKKITCPVLVIIADRDQTTPAKATFQAAQKLSQRKIVSYDCGHFDVYLEPIFFSAVAEQANFLKEIFK